MTSESGKTRRRYGRQFKAMVLAWCNEPGMSVAQVARSHGINDISTASLLARVLVAKFLDHLPLLYRQEVMFKRAGHLIARSNLARWVGECGAQLQPLVNAPADELRRLLVLHADNTPVAMHEPKHLRYGKTHKACFRSYYTTSAIPAKAVVFEFC